MILLAGSAQLRRFSSRAHLCDGRRFCRLKWHWCIDAYGMEKPKSISGCCAGNIDIWRWYQGVARAHRSVHSYISAMGNRRTVRQREVCRRSASGPLGELGGERRRRRGDAGRRRDLFLAVLAFSFRVPSCCGVRYRRGRAPAACCQKRRGSGSCCYLFPTQAAEEEGYSSGPSTAAYRRRPAGAFILRP